MINLLIILPGLGMGGAEHMVYELIKNLDHNLYATKVLCYGGKKNTPLEKQMETECKVIYGDVRGTISLLDFFKVFKIMNSVNPDIIHAHMGGVTFAVPWSWIKKKPLVITVHTKPEKAFRKKNEWMIRHSLKRVKLVAVSEDNKKRLQRYYSVDDSICECINNGIDINRFTRKEHSAFSYINVARQDENKNQKSILDSFAKVHAEFPNTKLFLIGDGPLHNSLCQDVKRMKLEDAVCIPGLTDTPEQYYSVSDVYVQSSHREAMPLSVLEAMAAGLPVISTDVGGLRDVVKDNGIIVEDNNPDALYRAMRQLIKSPDCERNRMGNASKEIVLNYSSPKMAKQYSNMYLSLLKNSHVI